MAPKFCSSFRVFFGLLYVESGPNICNEHCCLYVESGTDLCFVLMLTNFVHCILKIDLIYISYSSDNVSLVVCSILVLYMLANIFPSKVQKSKRGLIFARNFKLCPCHVKSGRNVCSELVKLCPSCFEGEPIVDCNLPGLLHYC